MAAEPEAAQSERYYCPDCGTVHREADGECPLECGEEMYAVSEEALRVLPHVFGRERYSPLCGHCGLRHDERIHRMERLAS